MSYLKAIRYRIQNRMEDIVRQHLINVIGMFCLLLFYVCPVRRIRYKFLMLSHRLTYAKSAQNQVLKHLPTLSEFALDFIPASNNVWEHVNQSRNITLKAPRIDNEGKVVEKGVLLIKFSTTFQYYLQHVDCAALQEYFILVLEPSWAGYCLPEILGWTTLPDPIVIESSEKRDRDFIASLNSNLIPVDFGSSDWVDHRLFHAAKSANPKYDAIYISNFNSIKRNHVFLKALRQLKSQCPDFRAALVCNAWGETKDNLYTLVEAYGLKGMLSVYEALSQAQLNDLLNQSKVNLLLSLKEGSNRSIFEALFTDTPGIVLKNNIGMNKNYINSQTGQLIDEHDLVNTLLHFREHWQDYHPRKWALAHISVEQTRIKLEAQLVHISKQMNWPWTSGTELKVNTPEVAYFDATVADHYPKGMSIFEAFKKGSTSNNRQAVMQAMFNTPRM